MYKTRNITLTELRAGFDTLDESFLCHVVRAVIMYRENKEWDATALKNCEDKLFSQMSAHAPELFAPWGDLTHGLNTVLDTWLNWDRVKTIPELDGMWCVNARGIHQIQENAEFRKALLGVMIRDRGDLVLDMR